MADEPSPDWAGLLNRLQALEQRLDRLEAALPTKAPPLPPKPAPQPADLIMAIPVVEPLPARTPPPPPAAGPPRPPPPVARPREDLEQTIGLKWAGWIGAIVLVVGVGLGIKFAYDQGWFGHLPVAVRLLFMSLGGFALLGAGEVVYRRVNILSAAALFGAGVGVLFLVSYAGNVYYGEYSYQTAFVFAVLTTLIGSAVAIRGRLASIAVLSQVGGHLAPFVLSTGDPPGLPLLAYVFTLQLVALILAFWGRTEKWWILRGWSLVATSWWVFIAVRQGYWGSGLAHEVLWFAVLYAAAYQVELLFSALRVGDAAEPAALPRVKGWGTVFSLAVTAGLTAVVLHVFYEYDSRVWRGAATLFLAGLCLASGFLLRPGSNPLGQALAVGYRVQGLALVILLVPVTLTGLWISLAWGVLALALAVLGARFDRGSARGAALTTWGLALLRLAAEMQHELSLTATQEIWLTLLDHPIQGTTVVGLILAGVGQAIASLVQMDLLQRDRRIADPWTDLARIAAFVATFTWCVESVLGFPLLGGTLALVLGAWLLAAADVVVPRLQFAVHAVCVLLFAAGKWVLRDTLSERLTPRWNALEYVPVFNPQMGLGVLLALSLAGVAYWRRGAFLQPSTSAASDPLPAEARLLAVAGLLLALVSISFSFEIDRVIERSLALGHDLVWPAGQIKLLGLTLLWTVAVVVLALVARRLVYGAALAWILLLVVGGKFLLVDVLLLRLVHHQGPAPVWVVLNFQVLTMAGVLAGFFVLHRLLPLALLDRDNARVLGMVANLLVLLIVLWAVTLEIDRAFATDLASGLSNPRLAKHVAISLFWSLFAVVAVAAGFRFRLAWLRYFGLGLFGVTLAKVAVLDVSEVQHGYRILSLLGLGLVLLATSVLYGQLSPRLLRERQAPEDLKADQVV